MLRLFTALALPPDVVQRLELLQQGLPGARWVPPENFHITLRFIGEVAEPVAEDIAAVLSDVSVSPFSLTLEGLGTFGADTKRSPLRALHALVRSSEDLTRLQRKIEAALQGLGLPPESRKFVPHVTIARLKDAPRERLLRYLDGVGDFRAGPFEVESFVLYESLRGAEAVVYRNLCDFPLIRNRDE